MSAKQSLPFRIYVVILYGTLVSMCCFLRAQSAHAQLLDPHDFSSLGTLNLAGGNFTFDTDARTIVDDVAPGVPLFTGVVDDQNGQASPGVVPEIAVFTFADIDLANTANIAVVGTRALALLSHSDIDLDTTLQLNGAGTGLGCGFICVGEAGGPGGFAGGLGATDGLGPGGGGFTSESDFFDRPYGAGAGLGSDGEAGTGDSPGLAGVSYGGLLTLLQGGSGGGGALHTLAPTLLAGGGGGGGALEVGAAGIVTIAAGGVLEANGGVGGDALQSPINSFGGNGSGGAIRLHGSKLSILGDVRARGGTGTGVDVQRAGGGGRVLVAGRADVVFELGDTIDTAGLSQGIDVSPGVAQDAPALNHGVVTVAPELTLVPIGQSLELGSVISVQVASPTQPGVNVVPGSLWITGSGEATVPVGGHTNRFELELDSPSASITGTATLTNAGELLGTGSVEVPVVNDLGGQINAVNDTLSFTEAVANNAGGQVNSINSALSFPGDGVPTSGGGDNGDGLTNNGDLTLIGTTVNGDVHSPTGSNIFVGGTGVVFDGLVSGGGNFPGVGAVTFNGGYEPGDSPAAVTMSGDLALGNTNTLYIELGGASPGSQFDQVNVVGDATIDGALDADVGFTPAHQDSFRVMTFASRSGVFGSVTDTGLADNLVMAPFYAANDLTLSAELLGDASGNGEVGPEDYTLWADGFGMAGPSYDDGDLSRNGSVGPEDYTIWADNFGLMASSPESGPAAVPEPSALMLLVMGACGVLSVRRRRRR